MTTSTARASHETAFPTLILLGLSHFLNDLIQSLIPAIYPILRAKFALDLVQIGMITLTFQIAGSLFQPLVGHYTDKYPLPNSSALGMGFTLAGVTALAFAPAYLVILAAVACIGIGSSIFHPEATRMARYAAHGRAGLAQGIFQVGGQIGGAFAPLAAALVIVPLGQTSLVGFAAAPILAMALLVRVAGQHDRLRQAFHSAANAAKSRQTTALAPYKVQLGLFTLVLLMSSKLAYLESFRSFYTFYVLETFGVTIPQSQLLLFVIFVSSAIGVLLGGMVGDRIGRRLMIWISVLGPLPLTLLLPHVGLTETVFLTILINLIMASAFSSIMLYAMDLMPGRIGLIGGIFYGLNFAIGGLAAAMLGVLADRIGLQGVYVICSFLPIIGLVTWFLPKTDQ